MKGVCFFVLLSLCLGALASKCTEECDAYIGPYQFLYGTAGNVTFCGTDLKTHNTFKSAINNFTYTGCYARRCGISVLYPGTCGCPNDCYSTLGRGECSNDKCKCAKGWGGKDCSNVVCPANKCSNHGSCVEQKDSKGGDYCQCDDGWTSADCSVPAPKILADRLPYGQIFPGNYYLDDDYGDFHPILNASLITTIRVTISQDKLVKMYTPANTWNLSDTKCEVFLFNGYVNKKIEDPLIEVHGALGRIYSKKSLDIKFGEDYKDLTGLTLTANNFDRMVIYQMMGEFHRAMMTQTHRISMAELWVNDIYYGMYTITERFNNHFENSRFNVKDNDMYKHAIFDAQYLGYNPAEYQYLFTDLYETPRYCVRKTEGDDNWSNYLGLMQALNSSNSAYRADYLTNHFDVDDFLRAIAIEAITMNYDGYSGCGNNWYLIDAAKHKHQSPYWKWAAFDFQAPLDGLNIYQTVLAYEYYNTTAAILNQVIEAGIFIPPNNISDNFLSQNPYKFIHRPEHPKPLLLAVMQLPGANATFTHNMQAFLQAVFVQNAAKLNQRFSAYYTLARPGLSRDNFYTIDGSSITLYDTAAYSTGVLMNQRFTSLLSLLGGL